MWHRTQRRADPPVTWTRSARLVALIAAAFPLSGLALVAAATPAEAATVTPPDMKIKVPNKLISIGTNPDTGERQLQFTHITWDGGTGPFEIDPSYDSSTGMAGFSQAIYKSPSPGVWKFDHSVPLAVVGTFNPPSDYRYPLTRFTLNTANADGSAGGVVATSPKTDYCITADAFVGHVPNTPNQSFIPQSNCTDPTKPLGWSIGWGDQYDQTDNGQPIDLTGVPDGTYILRATVDPEHLLTESNISNNVVDTKLQISGSSVTVLSKTHPPVIPPAVTLTSPTNGSSVSGTVLLQASASATAPATVASVQFLLDGLPLGSPVTSAPYSYNWTVGSTSLGSHQLSARVTDSAGNMGTAPVETVIVTSGGSGGPVLDQSIIKKGTGPVTTAAFSTSASGETLLAMVGSDGPAGSGQQTTTVSGAGLSWSRVKRSNSQSGDSEIWAATATGQLTNATVTSTPSVAGYSQQLNVLTFENAAGVGGSGVASGPSGGPSVSLTTTAANSLSFAVGNDYDNAIARTLGAGQALISQWVNATSGDTYWVQGTSAPSTTSGQSVTLNDTAPTTDQWNFAAAEVTPAPTASAVSIINPAPGQTVSGTVPVAASATGDVSAASVRFFVDGKPLGGPIVRWDTATAANGAHLVSAQVTDTSGKVVASPTVPVTVQNPGPPMTCFVLQADVSVHGHGTLTTGPFHTASSDETLLAFVSSDGPRGEQQQVSVSGAGLKWTLVTRANRQSGDAEIWQATAPRILTSATVKSTQAKPGYDQSLTVIAMEGTDGVGASAVGSGASGAPKVQLTTTKPTALIFAVGSDLDNAVARARPTGWVSLNQWLDTGAGNTSWSQYTNVPVGTAGTKVTVGDTAPVTDQWNLAAVELPGDGN